MRPPNPLPSPLRPHTASSLPPHHLTATAVAPPPILRSPAPNRWYMDRVDATVKRVTEETGANQVHLVAHSAGGWLGRAYLAGAGCACACRPSPHRRPPAQRALPVLEAAPCTPACPSLGMAISRFTGAVFVRLVPDTKYGAAPGEPNKAVKSIISLGTPHLSAPDSARRLPAPTLPTGRAAITSTAARCHLERLSARCRRAGHDQGSPQMGQRVLPRSVLRRQGREVRPLSSHNRSWLRAAVCPRRGSERR